MSSPRARGEPPRTLLVYPPLQFPPGAVPRPDGSLGIAYLAGALRDAGLPVEILDAAAQDVAAFLRRERLPSGLVRVGMSDIDIAVRCAGHDVIGVSSAFTAQHRQAVDLVDVLRAVFPDKLLLVGGTSARHLAADFFDAGADVVFASEAEREIIEVVQRYWTHGRSRGRGSFGLELGDVPGLVLPDPVRRTRAPEPVANLDALPVPAWDLLPIAAHAAIGRPHGGRLGAPAVRYAPLMTSRGCPFECKFCHISTEGAGAPSGDIGRPRFKSLERVERELDALQALGVERVYVEDDSLLAKKPRALELFRRLRRRGLQLADVNGVNIAHLFRRTRTVASDGASGSASDLEPDVELLEAMAASGFDELSLPFESGSQRVIDRWASGKWRVDACDTVALVRAALRAGLRVDGNYMLGYPDESEREIELTLDLARRHRDAGLACANVFCVVPFPGTALFAEARSSGWLQDDWDPDAMLWFNPVMRGTAVPPERLREVREAAWHELNDPEFTAARERAALAAPPVGGAAARACQGCRALDAAHDFGPTCTLEDKP